MFCHFLNQIHILWVIKKKKRRKSPKLRAFGYLEKKKTKMKPKLSFILLTILWSLMFLASNAKESNCRHSKNPKRCKELQREWCGNLRGKEKKACERDKFEQVESEGIIDISLGEYDDHAEPVGAEGEVSIPHSPDDYIDGDGPPEEPSPEITDTETNAEEQECAGLTGRDRIICRRKLILTGSDDSTNPCEGLRGRERGKCERDRRRDHAEPEGGHHSESNPCAGLRGIKRRMCERNHRREEHHGRDETEGGGRFETNPCAELTGYERGMCERNRRRGRGEDGADPIETTGKVATIYEPLGNDRIRLSGTSTYFNAGNVKIYRNDSWGYVCDDDWDIKDADVACKQLGYERGAEEFLVSSWYGDAKDNFYLMDNVKCLGDETQLQKCSYDINHDCQADEAAGVICALNTGCEEKWTAGKHGCYRLFSGSTSRYSAENTCKSIKGHLARIETQEENDFINSILRSRKGKHYWLIDGIKETDWIWKTTGEPISKPLWFPGWEPQSQFPKPSNKPLQRCVALSNTFNYNRETFMTEYFYWDNVNCNRVANFICETEKASPNTTVDCYHGNGTDYRGTRAVSTKGSHCLKWSKSRKINPRTHPDKGLGDHNYCRNPDNDTRPWCWTNYRRNLFGYCDIPKCPDVPVSTTPEPEITQPTTKTTTTPIPSTTTPEQSIYCPKDEMYCPSSGKCISLSWKCDNETDCEGGEDEKNCEYKLNQFVTQRPTFTIRRDPVEVYISIPLETCARICINHRKFACKAFYYELPQNHCSLYDTAEGSMRLFGHKGQFYVLDESCEEDDFECNNGKCISKDKVCNQHNDCADFSDEASCETEDSIELRLEDGSDEHSGRLEIKYLDEWGIICDDDWDINDANVACKMLGYKSADSAYLSYTISDGDRDFFLSNVNCKGNETSLLQCKRDPWGNHNCKAHEVVGIVCHVEKVCKNNEFTCSEGNKCIPNSFVCDGDNDCPDGSDEKKCKVEIKLVGGSSDLVGRVEITRAGMKGSICDDEFGNRDAMVICKMMGHGSGKVIHNIFGNGEGAIWADDLNCIGYENKIQNCPGFSWGEHDCTHDEDVAVRCFGDAETTTLPPISTTTTAHTNQSDVVCGKRPRAARRRREERTVAKENLSRIVGGTNATYGIYPWQVAVRLIDSHHPDGSRTSSHWCGASILSDYWVISAAHCFPAKIKKERILIRTGDLNSKIWDAHEQSFLIEHLVLHPGYSTITYDYDISLIKLKPNKRGTGIIFNDYVQPVCLPPDNLQNSPGTRCEISGWGSTGQIYPSVLKAATVPLLSRRICNRVYKDLTPRMLCAGYLEGGIDTCQGDSGGPLVCNINGVYTLIGITSWGNGCAKPNYPGVYTNVTTVKPWIEATMAKYS